MAKENPKIAVISFPGTNCELETARAVERNGMTAELFRWNEGVSFTKFDGAIIAGGFSYEDRGRSGLIASKDPLIEEVYRLAKRGKVVLGICNGAQVLVETGLVPNFEFGKSVLALTRNRRVKDGVVQGTGFYNAWVHLKPGSDVRNAFNQFEGTIRIPMAHAEGRYFSNDPHLLEQLITNGQNAFVYCDEKGDVIPDFPVNPNGSVLNLAGVTNPAGNVMSLMPHPERTAAGDPVFQSIHQWITGEVRKPAAKKFSAKTPSSAILPKPKVDVELFVALKITDNEALSVGAAAGMELQKFRWFGMKFSGDNQDLEKIIRSGELLNAEKETVWIKRGDEIVKFDKGKGFLPAELALPENKVLASEREKSLDEARVSSINKTLGRNLVKNLNSGVIWGAEVSKAEFDKVVRNNFFHHPAAADLIEI
ncbi:MAG: phosphoribosylformylglycinamidine synthase I [Patescibacteria group bacterium]